jgi:thioredoxin 1
MKICFIGIIVLLGCFSFVKAQTFSTLTATEFDKKATATKNKVILDVRTADEFKEGHLPAAIQIDYYASEFKNRVKQLDKSKPIFVYCKGGGRSSSSCEILKGLGFKEVYNLEGGIIDWKGAGKKVVK